MRRYRKYVIGYDYDRDIIYGKEEHNKLTFVNPMTLKQAVGQLAATTTEDNGRIRTIKQVVYELVPVSRA
jgi:hypothetical protein